MKNQAYYITKFRQRRTHVMPLTVYVYGPPFPDFPSLTKKEKKRSWVGTGILCSLKNLPYRIYRISLYLRKSLSFSGFYDPPGRVLDLFLSFWMVAPPSHLFNISKIK